jgi:hypothetical protein
MLKCNVNMNAVHLRRLITNNRSVSVKWKVRCVEAQRRGVIMCHYYYQMIEIHNVEQFGSLEIYHFIRKYRKCKACEKD